MSEGVQGNREAISAPASDAPKHLHAIVTLAEPIPPLIMPHPFPPIVRLVADEL